MPKAKTQQLTGLIDASGPGGCQSQGQRGYTFVLHLAAWRVDGGPVQRGVLRLEHPISEATLDRRMDTVKPYSLVRAPLVRPIYQEKARLLAQVSKATFGGTDAELQAIAAELAKPVHVKTKRFGKFKLHRGVNLFEGKAPWMGRPIRATLSVKNPEATDDLEKRLARVIDAAEKIDAKARKVAEAEFFELSNAETWLERSKPRSLEQFQKALKPYGVAVNLDDRFEIEYSCGDLFWGHSIVIRGSFGTKPRWEAELAG